MPPHADHAAPASSPRGTIGLLLVRVVVPLWVLAGALFKLWERNPKLLPQPVRDVSVWVAQRLEIAPDDYGLFLDSTLRFLIGAEFILVMIMIFVPRLARAAAIFTLSVFVLVLIGVLASGADSCGCFGTGGPPPWAMLVIDGLLLAGVLWFKPSRSPSRAALVSLAAVGGLAAFGVAFLIPNPVMQVPGEPTVADVADAAWPTPPAPKSTYFPQLPTWQGQPLRDIDLAQQIMPRPLPEGIDQGTWHLVLYRGDCDHCHALLEKHMASRATRTLAVRVPDTDPGSDMAMPAGAFHLRTLPEGPNYVFTTPVLATVVDGVVRAVCADTEDKAQVEATLAGGGSGAALALEPATVSTTAPAAAAAAAPAPTPSAAAPPTAAWPAAPALATTYFPQFETWKGTRIDAQPLALHASPSLAKLNQGRWHVLLYRADCDHCHALMEDYLVGPLEERVVAIRVPDTDPAADMPMPLTVATMSVLPEGPNYVFSTPVLLTVVDGTIVGMALDSENEDEVKACLAAGG